MYDKCGRLAFVLECQQIVGYDNSLDIGGKTVNVVKVVVSQKDLYVITTYVDIKHNKLLYAQ